MKFIKNLTILLSSLAAVTTISQVAQAQNTGLDVGGRYRIPPGLESNYLQYQLQNNAQGLRQMRVIPDCSWGFGTSCNKTGTILEKIIESNTGVTYQQMLDKAFGGQANSINYSKFYPSNITVPQDPYISIWKNYSTAILDSYPYAIGGRLSRNPVPGLRDVVNNFYWSPVPGDSLLSAFTNLKYSYGRVLLEQAAKIPNWNEQIRQLNLDRDTEKFLLNNLQRGLNALESGSNEKLRLSILTILSRPYSSEDKDEGWYGRYLDTLPDNASLNGQTLVPDSLDNGIASLPGDEIVRTTQELYGDVTTLAAGEGDNLGLLGALGGAALLALLLASILGGGGGGSSSSSLIADNPSGNSFRAGDVCDFNNQGGGVPVGNAICETPNNAQPVIKKRVDEPSIINSIILLTLILCLIKYRRRQYQVKG